MRKLIQEQSHLRKLSALLVCLVLIFVYAYIDKIDPKAEQISQFFSSMRNLALNIIPSIFAAIICFWAIYFAFINKKMIGFTNPELLPEIQVNQTKSETYKFMTDFISKASSSVIIVSNSLRWLEDSDAKDVINAINKKGSAVEIITPKALSEEIRQQISKTIFLNTGSESPPMARFTLINVNCPANVQLAISLDAHPNHQIVVYDNSSGAHIISLASDLVSNYRRCSKKP